MGGTKVGGAGTIPFGQGKPLNPPGSCPANPDGPIADGTQLVSITQDPGVPGGAQGGGKAQGNGKAKAGAKGAAPAPTEPAAPPAESPAPPANSGAKAPAGNVATGGAGGAGGGFKLQNGKDAQALNAKFEGLNAGSACKGSFPFFPSDLNNLQSYAIEFMTDGDQACIDGGFAQCVGGKFAVTQCAGGTKCIALPLVNKPGTSITCTTEADATARIEATGATGGISG